jgi:hypothetical protein
VAVVVISVAQHQRVLHPHQRLAKPPAHPNERLHEVDQCSARRVKHVDRAALHQITAASRNCYERAAARWIARLIAERPGMRLSELELVAAGFREALHSDRGVNTLRECLVASTRSGSR